MFKVLLVDDEPLVREGLMIMVDWRKYGFIVSATASNGEDALEIIKLMNPHVVITDICMPVIDGIELIKEANQIPNLRSKFVILSGYDNFAYAKKAMYYNVNHYILKPIDPEEIGQILQLLRTQLQEEAGTQEASEQVISFITDRTLYRIRQGEKKESLFAKAKFLLSLSGQEYLRIVLLKIESFPQWTSHLDEITIKEKREELIRELQDLFYQQRSVVCLHIYEEGLDEYGLLLNDKFKDQNDLKKFLQVFREKIWQRCKVKVTLFVSDQGEGVAELEKLNKQVLEIRKYQFFNRIENVFFYEKVFEKYINYEFYRNDLNDLLQEIENDNAEKIELKVKVIFNKFYTKKASTYTIEAFITNLRAEIIKRVYELNGNTDEFGKKLLNYKIDMMQANFMEVTNVVTSFCIYGGGYLSGLKKEMSLDIIYEIEKYTKENYRENLQLQDLAGAFYMNSVYLGQLFKKKTGLFYSDYLHHVRIEEAKKLLQRTNMKITEVAQAVGYNNVEYFRNKFKNITNLTPSIYKEQNTL